MDNLSAVHPEDTPEPASAQSADPPSSPLSEPDGLQRLFQVDYPRAGYDPLTLPYHVRLLVVARHSKCDECKDGPGCLGYRQNLALVSQAADVKAASDEVCTGCAHAMTSHGAPQALEMEELTRRCKVAARIDELLADRDKELDDDFADTDEDTASLRRQMILEAGRRSTLKRSRSTTPDPARSSPPQPPTPAPATAGKGTGEFALGSRTGGIGGEAEGQSGKVLHGPLAPAATATTQDGQAEAQAHAPKVKSAVREEEANVIRFHVVANDGDPFSMVILTGMKNIFQKQLPKMPREYIARLVYDRNHYTMAIVKNGLQVVGGITYRPFYSRTFAEIVFCAIASNEQVRGYGSHLMNHLKDHVRASAKGQIKHFLTYADNYAIGYFKKQGFTKDITLEKRLWVGYIKDYEGGTIMQCTMLPKIDYLRIGAILALQKEAIMAKIREFSKSHVVHPGLEVFKQSPDRRPSMPLDVKDVPGLKESGWTPAMDALAQRPARGPHFTTMQHLLFEMQNHNAAWAFLQPVNRDEVADYYDVITVPMDLSTMESKLEAGHYKTLDDFVHDAQTIFDNCRLYNAETTAYHKNATKLEAYLKKRLAEIQAVQAAETTEDAR